MSLFSKYDLAQVTGIKANLSADMINKIDLWNNLLMGSAPWSKEAPACGVIETVIGKLSNAVGEEVDIRSENEELAEVMGRLNENSKELIQNIIALGGCIVRPTYSNGKAKFEIIKLGNYIPTSYDLDGTLTGAVITKKLMENGREFLLLEIHKFNPNYTNEKGEIVKAHEIENRLYIIKGEALTPAALDACSITAGLDKKIVWEKVDRPLIVEFRNRTPNNIDGSAVPCALWQNTENLIEDADLQYKRITWEQEGGELKVFADEDLFKRRQKSRQLGGEVVETSTITPKLSKLIVKLSGNGTSEEKITTFAPPLRTTQQIEAFNQILRRIELAWNIGKGTLSDLEAVAQTATQYTGGKKTLYSLVDSLESELEEKYRYLAYIFAYMLSALNNSAFNDNLEIIYNDTARKDPEALRLAALQELQNNIITAAEYRERIFGEDPETAEKKAPAIGSGDFGGAFNFE